MIHPVIVGKDLWHRTTGYENFYEELVRELHESIISIDTENFLIKGCNELAEEIKESPLFDF